MRPLFSGGLLPRDRAGGARFRLRLFISDCTGDLFVVWRKLNGLGKMVLVSNSVDCVCFVYVWRIRVLITWDLGGSKVGRDGEIIRHSYRALAIV